MYSMQASLLLSLMPTNAPPAYSCPVCPLAPNERPIGIPPFSSVTWQGGLHRTSKSFVGRPQVGIPIGRRERNGRGGASLEERDEGGASLKGEGGEEGKFSPRQCPSMGLAHSVDSLLNICCLVNRMIGN